jgi:hypothetical protein
MIEYIFGWLIIWMVGHPVAAFFILLVGFALYCWLIDWIGYRLFRKKPSSEAVECPHCGKRYTRPD